MVWRAVHLRGGEHLGRTRVLPLNSHTRRGDAAVREDLVEGASNAVVVRIHLFGPLRVTTSGVDITPRAKKTRALLAYLALSPHLTAERATLAGLLWSDRGKAQAVDSFRQCLRDLRRCLDVSGAKVVWSNRHRIGLSYGRCAIDILELDESNEPACYEVLSGLEGGDRRFDEWLVAERASRRAQVLAVLHERLTGPAPEHSRAHRLRVASSVLRLAPDDPIASEVVELAAR